MRHPAFRFVVQSVDGKAAPRVMRIDRALAAIRNGKRWDAHRSIARYDDALDAYWREHRHLRGYAGPAYADHLPCDVDRELIGVALADARKLALTFHEHYGVREDAVRYFFSGSKGFHLLVPMALCGDVGPSIHTPAILKRMAMAVAEYASVAVDLNVYRRLGTLRVAGTQHPARPPAGRSYCWKVELTWAEFSTLTGDEILGLATDEPRELEYQPHDLEPIDVLEELHARCALEAEEYASRPSPEPVPARGEPVDVGAVASVVAPYYVEGKRHDISLWLAGYLARSGIAQEDAEAVVRAIAAGEEDDGEATRILSQKDHMLTVGLGELSQIRILVPAHTHETALRVLAEHASDRGDVAFACPECGEAYGPDDNRCRACGRQLPSMPG